MKRIDQYIEQWKQMGYSDDIPDEVPDVLMQLGLAPSYKQIAICILKNDMQMLGLGFQPVHSKWYDTLKRIEIAGREKIEGCQLTFNFHALPQPIKRHETNSKKWFTQSRDRVKRDAR
jgi:hypothetical protein